jgi:hypothetical protein
LEHLDEISETSEHLRLAETLEEKLGLVDQLQRILSETEKMLAAAKSK